jgi:carbamoyl-phosphate synthase large subunit
MSCTVLVSGASGIVGYGALRALRQHPAGLHLIGTTIYEESVAPAFSDLFLQAPPTDAPGYMDWLVGVIRKHEVKLLIPGIEADLYQWTDHAAAIQSAGAQVVLNNPELVHLCRDKWKFYEALATSDLSCAIPTTLESDFKTLVARFGLPLLLKPRRGFASKGISRISDRGQFDLLADQIGPLLMVQPLIGSDNEEYTTSAFGDGQGGLSALMTLRRRLSRDGYTEKAEVVSSEAFIAVTRELCAHFRPLGPTNFQYRLCDDGVRLLEINPRVSSSTSIRTAFGYNECAMAVDFYLHGRLPEQPRISGGKAVRYTEDCIFHESGLHF